MFLNMKNGREGSLLGLSGTQMMGGRQKIAALSYKVTDLAKDKTTGNIEMCGILPRSDTLPSVFLYFDHSH